MNKTQQQPRKVWSRRDVLSFMVTMAVAAKEPRAAEGYMLELVACLAFTEWDETRNHLTV